MTGTKGTGKPKTPPSLYSPPAAPVMSWGVEGFTVEGDVETNFVHLWHVADARRCRRCRPEDCNFEEAGGGVGMCCQSTSKDLDAAEADLEEANRGSGPRLWGAG